MYITSTPSKSVTARPIVIALPCSGSSGRQWRSLEAALNGRCTVFAPDLMDHATAVAAAAKRGFRLLDEATPLLRLIDRAAFPVHLVGHSYGGAVALRAALERPEKIRSLTLFEPTPFHLLDATSAEDVAALNQVRKVASDVSGMIACSRHLDAARIFVDYWSGSSVWSKLRPESRDAIIHYAPKAALEFDALFNEPMRLPSYARLEVPIVVLEGEYAPAPAHRIARLLAAALPLVFHAVIPRVGHMAPVTDGELIAAEIANYMVCIDQGSPFVARPGRAAA